MVQEIYIRSMIAPVVVAGILILAVLTAIPSNALMTHSSSEYEKCVKSSNNCFLQNNESSNAGNGATSQESSNAGNGATSQESSNAGNGATSQESSNAGNGRTNTFVLNPPTSSQESGNTGNAAHETGGETAADFTKTILDIHNNERDAVGSPLIKWSDSLAADAKSWAEHLAQLGKLEHATGTGQGENLSYRSDSRGPSAISTADLLNGWVNEKNGYTVAPMQWDRDKAHGHYTQMVWKTTTEVGCGTASSGNSVYLVCRYSPPGNYPGQSPY
jgi:uncharacterized protein YkwD